MMLREYVKFSINGGLLGLVAWWLQQSIYLGLGGATPEAYLLASALTYLPLVLVNFYIQRRWIFFRPGLFWRFVLANLAIMLLVSVLSPWCWRLVDLIVGPPWGERSGFAVAAVIGSVPSFLIKRHWVFGKRFRIETAPVVQAMEQQNDK